MSTSPSFHKTTLKNGITVVAEKHTHVRSIAAGLWVKAGSQLEPLSVHGISHFIEHMVFKGTKRRDALEIATALESVGGDLNAFTDREHTCFHALALNEHLALSLDLLADLVSEPLFDPEQLARERKVLLQEFQMIEDSPDDIIQDGFLEAIWPKHPLGRTIIGTKKTIQSISRKQLQNYFKNYYTGGNMVLSVAGNFEWDELVALAERCFEKVPASPTKTKPVKRAKFVAKRKSLTCESDQVFLLCGFEGVGFKHPDRFPMLLLSFFLGGGMSSKLFQEVREKAALAYSVDSDFVPFTDTGVFFISVQLAKKSLKPCMEILRREINELREKPLPAKALEIVKGQLKGAILLSSEQMETRQESLGRNEIVFGRYIPVEEVIDEIDKVTPEMLIQAAQDMFVPAKQAVLVMSREKIKTEPLWIV